MSALSLEPPDHEPAWYCADCGIVIEEEEADVEWEEDDD